MGCDAEAGAQQASFRTGRRALVLGSLFTPAGCSALKPPKSTQVSAKITADLSINPAPDGTATGRNKGRKRPDILPQPRPSRFS